MTSQVKTQNAESHLVKYKKQPIL